MTPTKVYLAGPMRGIHEFNEFREAAAKLRAAGYDVLSPAERETEHPPRELLAADLNWICLFADAIAVLPGWEHSLAAAAELATARALGLPVIKYVTRDLP